LPSSLEWYDSQGQFDGIRKCSGISPHNYFTFNGDVKFHDLDPFRVLSVEGVRYLNEFELFRRVNLDDICQSDDYRNFEFQSIHEPRVFIAFHHLIGDGFKYY